jgi:hypothetical protein
VSIFDGKLEYIVHRQDRSFRLYTNAFDMRSSIEMHAAAIGPLRHDRSVYFPESCVTRTLAASCMMAFEFAFAVATRVVLSISPLGSSLQDDNQLSSPLTSYSRRKRLLQGRLYVSNIL